MKIFLDTADTEAIAKRMESGLVDGVTTNPSLIKKSGRDPYDVYAELIDLGVPDISMEVVGDAREMFDEALNLVDKFDKYATIKLPCTKEGLQVCSKLEEWSICMQPTKPRIRTNVTLILSAAQAILDAKAGATYVSPFIGRYDDNSISGLELVRSITEIYYRQGVQTKVLAASLRDVYKVSRSYFNGAHIVTMPPAILEKMFNHVLTDAGLEIFQRDYEETLSSLNNK